jgi:hypothetical protein
MDMVDQEIVQRLAATQDLLSKLDKHIQETVLFQGKTLAKWRQELGIKLPEDIDWNFQTVIRLSAEIMRKYQNAAYFRDLQQVNLITLEQVRSEKYNSEFQNIRMSTEKEFGKPMAAESCKSAASVAVKDIDDALTSQRFIHQFWSKTCDVLTETRKLLEVIGYGLSGESRVQRDFVIRNGEENAASRNH